MPVRGRGYGFRQKTRFRYTLLRRTLLYIVIAAAASFGVLYLLNNNAAAQAAAKTPAPSPTPTVTATPAPSPSQANPYACKITGVPTDAKELWFSFDGKYGFYSNGISLTVMDTQANKTLKTISDPGLAWARFADSRDIVLYLTLQGNTVTVNTYDIQKDAQIKQVSFTVPAGAKVKSAAFSSAKNYLCVNIYSGSDEVYTVDIMKRTARLTLQDVINNMVLLHRANQVYYTNGKGNLYFGSKAVGDVGEGVVLGLDAKDKLYFQPSADKSNLNVIADGKKEKTIQMTDLENLVEYYGTYSNLYAVFDGYLVDVSADPTAHIAFDKGLDFAGIGGRFVFFRNAAGDILGYELLGK